MIWCMRTSVITLVDPTTKLSDIAEIRQNVHGSRGLDVTRFVLVMFLRSLSPESMPNLL